MEERGSESTVYCCPVSPSGTNSSAASPSTGRRVSARSSAGVGELTSRTFSGIGSRSPPRLITWTSVSSRSPVPPLTALPSSRASEKEEARFGSSSSPAWKVSPSKRFRVRRRR